VKYKDGSVKNGMMRTDGKKMLYNNSGEYLRDLSKHTKNTLSSIRWR
jgi:hypothetical protein